MLPCQRLDLLEADRMTAAAIIGPVPQRHHQQTPGAQQPNQLPEGARAVHAGNVLPDGAQQHDMGGQAKPADSGQPGKAVRQPADPRQWVQTGGFGAHALGRFDGDDIVAGRGEGAGIAAGARSDVDDQGRWRREQVGQPVTGHRGSAKVMSFCVLTGIPPPRAVWV